MSSRKTVPTRKTPDFGFPIGVSGRGSQTRVSVHSNLERLGLPGFVLLSSGYRAPLIEGGAWPPGLQWSIEDRLRNDGPQKGRVFGVWQGGRPVGFCSWHLHSDGPLVMFDLACRRDLPRAVAKVVEGLLLLSLRQVAGSPGIARDTTSLRWTDLPLDHMPDVAERDRLRGAIRTRAARLGFEALTRKPLWLSGHWVAVRRF